MTTFRGKRAEIVENVISVRDFVYRAYTVNGYRGVREIHDFIALIASFEKKKKKCQIPPPNTFRGTKNQRGIRRFSSRLFTATRQYDTRIHFPVK